MKYNRREEIYNALALDERYKTSPVFLFRTERNKITAKSVLLRPTVFDAGNYPPFLPVVDQTFKLYGYTDPHNDPALLIAGVPLINEKCPESIVNGEKITWEDINHISEI